MPEPMACPTCGKPVPIASDDRPKAFPFCSGRCRDRDFGAWIDGRFVVAGETLDADREADGDIDRYAP